jgi:predicted ArsR family transcriptional regulator
MTMEYNERKILVLEYARAHHEFSAAQLAQDQRIPGRHAKIYLLKYHKQGLLSRHQEGGVYSYSLAEKGRQRLQFFAETMPEIFKALVH